MTMRSIVIVGRCVGRQLAERRHVARALLHAPRPAAAPKAMPR
ncbi:hypothetical protein [Luteimonas sp. S4-F44]|nr:hypothetical protein [Luteimonas sp. S4-F44]